MKHYIVNVLIFSSIFFCETLCYGDEPSPDPVLVTQRGHRLGVTSVAFSPEGLRALAGDQDNTAILWDVPTGREIRRFEGRGNSGEVVSVAFSPDGARVLTAGLDWTIILWEVATGRELRRFQGEDVIGEVVSVAFSPDGARVLAGGKENAAILWDVATGREIRRFGGNGKAGVVGSVAFSSDGARVLTGGLNHNAILWDVATGREVRRLMPEGDVDNDPVVAFSSDGALALTRGRDQALTFRDVTDGRVVRCLREHDIVVNAVAYSSDGKRVATGGVGRGGERVLILWDAETGREVRRWTTTRHLFIGSIALSRDGDHALVTGLSLFASLWDTRTGREIRLLEGNTFPIMAVDFLPGRVMVMSEIGREDRTAIFWDLTTGKATDQFRMFPNKRRFEAYPGHKHSFSFEDSRPSGPKFSLAPRPEFLALRDWTTSPSRLIQRFKGNEGQFSCATCSPDDKWVLTGGRNSVTLWDTKTGREVWPFEGHTSEIVSLSFSGDGSMFVSGSRDCTAKLWERETRRNLCTFVEFKNGSWAVVDPDGRFDTDSLEQVDGLHWVFPDEPLRPLPVELYMRDYYEPRLLPRILRKESFPNLRPLGELIRAQPSVAIERVERGNSPDLTLVTLKARAAEGHFRRNDRETVQKTDVYDLRLFRDGQLVGRWPEPAEDTTTDPDPMAKDQMDAWRDANRVTDGTASRTFSVRLPHREKAGPMEFTAYAFNEDRVKSTTARTRFDAPANPPISRPHAYLICMGVASSQNRRWDLAFPASDARRIQDVLRGALERQGHYEVVPVLLTSEAPRRGLSARPQRPSPT